MEEKNTNLKWCRKNTLIKFNSHLSLKLENFKQSFFNLVNGIYKKTYSKHLNGESLNHFFEDDEAAIYCLQYTGSLDCTVARKSNWGCKFKLPYYPKIISNESHPLFENRQNLRLASSKQNMVEMMGIVTPLTGLWCDACVLSRV